MGTLVAANTSGALAVNVNVGSMLAGSGDWVKISSGLFSLNGLQITDFTP